jgi:hypothetical protein
MALPTDARLHLAPPLTASGCRNLYHVTARHGDLSAYAGCFYIQTEQYPNHYTLARPLVSEVSAEVRPTELAPNFEWVREDNLISDRFTRVRVSCAGLSDGEVLQSIAKQLYTLSQELTASLSARPKQYDRGAWQAGVMYSSRQPYTVTAEQLSPRQLTCCDGGCLVFYARHKSGTEYRLSPYWHTEENRWQYLRLRETCTTGTPRPLPKHVTGWILSRCKPY